MELIACYHARFACRVHLGLRSKPAPDRQWPTGISPSRPSRTLLFAFYNYFLVWW